MNRKYNLKLDLQFRCNNSIMKFNQFDNNTSDFFMRITNGGNLVDIEKAIVVLAVIKPSGKVSSQFIEVKNGLVYVDLKSNMKDEIGTYTAQAMLILEDERVVTDSISYKVEEDKIFSLLNDTVEDTEDFTLLTDMLNRLSTIEISEEQRVINEAERILSEENRKIEEAKRVEAELIRQHEEADRTKYDAIRESNENIRKQNESRRLANETNRIDEETKRVEEEANRVEAEQLRKDNYNFMTEDEERRRVEANAHKEAEKIRAQAENTRVNEEAKRRTTEQARVSAENTRVSNENTRKANETTRQTNETYRVEAETQRQNRYNSFIANAEANANNFESYTNTAKVKEEERKSNELDRRTQETKRVSNEVERISNENTRKANEVVREKNETSRQYVFENKVNEVDKKIVELNTTKDNFVSNINTKVDTKISEIDNVKDNFVSSVNTKVDTKISELDTAKSDMTNTVASKVNEVENRFNALTSKQQQDAEVIDARDGETSLKARLDRDIEKAKQVYVNVEGSSISTDSSVGYAKDVEILGNTIQDSENLADIRSVGDTVEGQELYEIPIVSCGKNLFNGCVEKGWVDSFGNLMDSNRSRTNLIKVNPNTKYILSSSNRYQFRVVFYTVNNVYISETVNMCDTRGMIFTTPTNCKYVRFMYAETVENSTSWKIQLEEGTQATPYEPYQEDKLTILSPTPLEKVGDVADRIIEKDGVWGVEKNIVDTILNGSENWSYSPTTKEFILTSPIYNHIQYSNGGRCISDKLAYSDSTTSTKDNVISVGNSAFLAIRKDIYTNLTDFKKYLSENNILVKYPTTQPQFIPLPHSQQVKLRTFAGKTNISFGCEIEGTIKAQIPKSLGATVNTHTEQINNLNKELDRVKKLEESTVSTVTTESDFTTVEATSNGYFEDVKLEGKTLANIVTTYDTSRFSLRNAIKQEDNYFKLQYGATVNDSNVIPRRGVHLYKPNTTYTIIVDIKENTTGTLLGISAINSCIDSTTISKRDFANLTGISTITFKTRDDITISDKGVPPTYDLYFGIWKDGGDLSKHITFRYLVLEGDHTQNPPSGYIEGLKSVGQDVDEVSVASVNENLFDGELVPNNINMITPGTNNLCSKNFIPVKEGNSYRINNDLGYHFELFLYDSNKLNGKHFLSLGISFSHDNPIFTIPQGYKYIKFRTWSNENNLNVNICVHDRDKNSSFEPQISDKKRLLYYNTETQAWEKPTLREWDSIEKHTDGKYYYHVRSIEEDYVEGDEIVTDYITDMTTTVKPLSQEKVYECTNIDLITYANETNYIIESGVLSPKTTLKVHSNISNVVSLLQKKVSLLESNVTSYMITQNRLMLASRYNADTVSFKVDVASFSDTFEYDNDLYELILNNILVGKDNYNREYIENLTRFYWMDFVISDEMYSTLFEIIEEQHNPKIEKETPLI